MGAGGIILPPVIRPPSSKGPAHTPVPSRLPLRDPWLPTPARRAINDNPVESILASGFPSTQESTSLNEAPINLISLSHEGLIDSPRQRCFLSWLTINACHTSQKSLNHGGNYPRFSRPPITLAQPASQLTFSGHNRDHCTLATSIEQ